jgi:hypothetical protein
MISIAACSALLIEFDIAPEPNDVARPATVLLCQKTGAVVNVVRDHLPGELVLR